MQHKEPNDIRLSLCMIVRDNAGTIEPCLESIRPWVDEMIVVDTGSKDRTPEIVQRHGARLYHFPWCDDFSAARNESLKYARGEWIFWMDSDDTIDPECGRKLRALADGEHPDQILGYVMQVHCPGSGEEGQSDVTVVDHVKMFRNRLQLRFEGRIHEQVLGAIRSLQGEVAWSDIYVVHSGSDHSEAGKQRKLRRDFHLLELDLRERPDHPFVLFNLGMTHADAEEYHEAIHYLQRSLEVAKPDESHVRKVYALLTSSFQQVERYDEAWATCQQGRDLFPEDAELLFREAMLHHHFERYDQAVASYQGVLDNREERHFTSIDRGIHGFKARHNLAMVYEEMSELQQAEEQWRQVVAEMPSYRSGYRGLAELLLRRGNLGEVDALAERLLQDPELERSALRCEGLLLKARVEESRNNLAEAQRLLEQAHEQFSDDLEPLRSLCRFLFERVGPNESESALLELTKRDPQDASAYHNLGTVYLHQGRSQQAVEAYRKSLDLRPDSTQTEQQLTLALNAIPQDSETSTRFDSAARGTLSTDGRPSAFEHLRGSP